MFLKNKNKNPHKLQAFNLMPPIQNLERNVILTFMSHSFDKEEKKNTIILSQHWFVSSGPVLQSVLIPHNFLCYSITWRIQVTQNWTLGDFQQLDTSNSFHFSDCLRMVRNKLLKRKQWFSRPYDMGRRCSLFRELRLPRCWNSFALSCVEIILWIPRLASMSVMPASVSEVHSTGLRLKANSVQSAWT